MRLNYFLKLAFNKQNIFHLLNASLNDESNSNIYERKHEDFKENSMHT